MHPLPPDSSSRYSGSVMILVCDIGTSALKIGVIDLTGTLRAYSREPIARPSGETWWRAFRRAVRTIPDELVHALHGISLSGNAPTLMPVDKNGRTVAGPLLWDDPVDDQAPPSVSYFLPKVLRYANERPREYERTACLLPSAEYLIFLLTGNKTAFIPHDEYIPYYWQGDEIRRFALDMDKFPALQFIGSQAGEVTAAAERLTGIKQGTRVFCGGADFLMAVLGSGALDFGQANDRGGTSEALNCCGLIPVQSPLLRSVPGLTPKTWNISGFVPDAGRHNAWLKEKLVGPRRSFEEYASLFADSIPGSSGLRFIPSRLAARGRYPEIENVFSGISPDTSRGELVRALWEYAGFSLRRIIVDLEKHKSPIQSLHSTGGLSKSDPLNQLKADITGTLIQIPEIEDSELLGNAIAAFVGSGEFATLIEAARKLVKMKAAYSPEPGLKELYDDLYEGFIIQTG
jgi:xylulokinase